MKFKFFAALTFLVLIAAILMVSRGNNFVALQDSRVKPAHPANNLPADIPPIPQEGSRSIPLQRDAAHLRGSDPTIEVATDEELAARFEKAAGLRWNQLLMEMAKRQTPVVVKAMAWHVTDIKGLLVRRSGEAMYAPELRFPVAQVLLRCGMKAAADLTQVAASDTSSLEKRVIAVRLLMQLWPERGATELSRLEAGLGSEAQRQLFHEASLIALDDARTLALFPEELEPPQLPLPVPQKPVR